MKCNLLHLTRKSYKFYNLLVVNALVMLFLNNSWVIAKVFCSIGVMGEFMKRIFKSSVAIVVFAGAALLLFSCSNSSRGLQARAKPESKPEIVDVLEGRSNADVLKIKYGAPSGLLRLTCTLDSQKTIKTTSSVFGPMSSGVTPEPPGMPHEPVMQNPSEDKVIFNLNSQLEEDPDLKKSYQTILRSRYAGRDIKLELNFLPVTFEEQINLQVDSSRYVMKHTPVVSYRYRYEINWQGSADRGLGEGKVYEKIDALHVIGVSPVDQDQYAHRLKCQLESRLNTDNAANRSEFATQWTCIGCVQTPVEP